MAALEAHALARIRHVRLVGAAEARAWGKLLHSLQDQKLAAPVLQNKAAMAQFPLVAMEKLQTQRFDIEPFGLIEVGHFEAYVADIFVGDHGDTPLPHPPRKGGGDRYLRVEHSSRLPSGSRARDVLHGEAAVIEGLDPRHRSFLHARCTR